MVDIGDTIDNRFNIIEDLGEGGMGTVFRAEDLATGSEVALKYCHLDGDRQKRRFAREVRSMQKIDHKHVMPILHSNTNFDPPYFTMPLANRSLEDEIQDTGGMNEDKVINYFESISKGVQALHNSGVTHRDIKPGNVMVMEDGRVVVSDMGLAKIMPRDTTTLTMTNDVLGTQGYMAPEQWQPGGSRDAGERTDIYQLGKTLYQLLTGEHPSFIDRSQLPDGLSYIVARATKDSPEQRYSTVGALMDAVKNYVESKDPETNPVAAFESDLEEALSSAKKGEYNRENLENLVVSIRRFRNNTGNFIDQFDLVPDVILQTLAVKIPDQFREILSMYADALSEEVGAYQFAYAETVADKMKVVFDSASDPNLKAMALRPTLVAAVELNRFAAMDTFDSMLTSIRSTELALAAADVLEEELDYYSHIADRIPRTKLDPAIQSVYDAAT
jgi:serine/threonine protein kinase